MQNSESKNLGEVFSKIYNSEAWGRGSGTGSYPQFTIEYRAFLEKFLCMNGIRSIVDIGCGDWQSTCLLDLNGVDYYGFDVIPSIVKVNTLKYGSKNVTFSVMPDDLDALPPADLLIMKDVLQHMPDHEIRRYQAQVFPQYRWCLLTNSYEKINTPRNTDIQYGDFRCLDLLAEPYRFPGTYLFEYWALPWERIRTLLIAQK